MCPGLEEICPRPSVAPPGHVSFAARRASSTARGNEWHWEHVPILGLSCLGPTGPATPDPEVL